jgi:hypothetical protein
VVPFTLKQVEGLRHSPDKLVQRLVATALKAMERCDELAAENRRLQEEKAAEEMLDARMAWCKESEMALLGSVWLSCDVSIIARLEEEDFCDEANRWVLSVFKAVVNAGEPLDAVAVTRRLRGWQDAPDGCDAAYLAEVLRSTPTAAHTSYYFRCVKKERLRRDLQKSVIDAIDRDRRSPNEVIENVNWLAEKSNVLFKQANLLTQRSEP